MYFLMRPVNQLLFLSLPFRLSPAVEAPSPKKNLFGYAGHTMPNSGLLTIATGQQNRLRKYSAVFSVLPRAPPFSSDSVGL